MSTTSADLNLRPPIDRELLATAEYVCHQNIDSDLAYVTAKYCLMDAIGCAIQALQYPECTRLLGPIVPGTVVPLGSRVLGTHYILDPILAAFNNSALIRWLDFNDTWLAQEWGHPSDNLGAILSVVDYESQKRLQKGQAPYTVRDILTAMIKAYEIQGILALENSFNRRGLDHVVLVKVASTALATFLSGGSLEQIADALSHAWIDGQSLRTYRHAPNTGSRKSWAAADATSRAVRLSELVMLGEMGYHSALTAKKWGFYDVSWEGNSFHLPQDFGSYVMENILFKIAYPAEFHAQTAVECAILLSQSIQNRLDQIDKIVIHTQESAVRIISKTGPLYNHADRDHCLQYMVAMGLLHGDLKAEYYDDQYAEDPRVDILREKMQVIESPPFSKDYLNPEKRSIANAIQIFFQDGSFSEKIRIDYPLGHLQRRAEGLPLLIQKFEKNLSKKFNADEIQTLKKLFDNQEALETLSAPEFLSFFTRS